MDAHSSMNLISGQVTGTAIQAGSIGQVVLPAPVVPVPRQLPPGIRDFAGRARELAELDAAVTVSAAGSGALTVVEGMGGVGKTSLVIRCAQQVADRFPDGTLFVNLRGYGPSAPLAPGVVLAGFVQALGARAEQVPADEDAAAGLYRSLLVGRRVLVVLDNAASAEQVRPLLPGAAGCAVVVTSRASLTGLRITDGAIPVAVAPMPVEEAVALVRGVVGGTRADAEEEAVVELAGLCGGLPLAVRVASCRAVRSLGGVAGVVAELADERDRVEGLSVPGDERSAVQGVFDLSYARLPERQARVFRLLGLHSGPEFSVSAVAALAGLGEREIGRVLEELADLHLVEPVAARRYRLHDLLYAYVVSRVASDEPAENRRRAVTDVVTWYAQAADAADRAAFPMVLRVRVELPQAAVVPVFDREDALAWLDAELPTLSAATQVAEREGVWAAAVVLAGVHHVATLRPRALWPSRLAAERAGVAAARAGGLRQAEALLLLRLADSYRLAQSWSEAVGHYEQALRVAQELEDTTTVCSAISGLGLTRLSQKRYVEALEHYLAALPLSRATGRPRLEAVVECNLSAIRVALGQYERALEHAERELVLRRRAGDELGEAYALYGIAVARWKLGQRQAAIDTGERAMEMFSSSGSTSRFTVRVLEMLASVYTELGQHDQAVRAWREAHSLMVELGDPRAEEVVLRLRELEAAAPPGSAAGRTISSG